MLYFCAVVSLHNATKVMKFLIIYTMDTKIIKTELPTVLPHGWKTEVATTLNIHPNTVTNALNAGNGEQYERIMKCAKEKYGKPIN